MLKSLKNMNTATKITMARIVMLPLILFFYISAETFDVIFFQDWGKFIAMILFVIAAATDFLDGYIARKYNQVTNTGKLLDPVADKMLTLLGFLLILSDPVWFFSESSQTIFPYWFAVLAVFIALGRDIIMNSLRFIAAEQGITIAADKLGKIKSTFQYMAIALYMLFAFNLNPFVQFIHESIWLNIFGYSCLALMATATVLSVYSCVNYIRNYTISAKEKKSNGAKQN